MRLLPHTFRVGLCLVLLAGCGVTKPSRFYLLTPIEARDAGTLNVPAAALGIGPVGFPAYLDRPEIVIRSSGNELNYAGLHRWAEPLKAAFSRTLAENLSIMLPAYRTVTYPWSRSTVPDYQVIVNVTRFDADAGGTIILTADWELIRTDDSTVITRKTASYTESAGSSGYPAVVAAQSRSVEQLGMDIATAITDAGLHTAEETLL